MESFLILICWVWKVGKCIEDIGILLVLLDMYWCDLLLFVNFKYCKLCFNNGFCFFF